MLSDRPCTLQAAGAVEIVRSASVGIACRNELGASLLCLPRTSVGWSG